MPRLSSKPLNFKAMKQYQKRYDIKTKEEFFSLIRDLTRDRYFFKVENYYQGGKANRSGYMVDVLGPISDE